MLQRSHPCVTHSVFAYSASLDFIIVLCNTDNGKGMRITAASSCVDSIIKLCHADTAADVAGAQGW